MSRLFGTPNEKSIGVTKRSRGMLFGMPTEPTTALGKRLRRIRQAAGYGGERQAAEFARRLDITPASLHDLESGKSQKLGGKAWQGYINVGANPHYILHGKGLPMLKDIEKTLRAQTLVSMMLELEEKELDTVEDIVKAYIRAKPGGSPNDPFKHDAPKGGGTQ